MVECKEILELLSELIDGELEHGLEAEILEHLGHCECCSPFIHTFKRTVTLCRSIETIDVPEEVHEEFWQVIRVEIRKNR